jgi:serpin B
MRDYLHIDLVWLGGEASGFPGVMNLCGDTFSVADPGAIRDGRRRTSLYLEMERPAMRRLIPFMLALAVLPGCDTHPSDPRAADKIDGLPRQLSATEVALVGAGNGFAFELLRAVHDEEEPEKNVFLSPLSASMALGMTLNGAAGETFDAMRSTLGFGALELRQINRSYRTLLEMLVDLDPAVAVGIANSIWHDRSVALQDEFLENVRDAFDSRIEALDFGDAKGSLKVINGWVKTATKGRIPTILDEIQQDEVMYLINAVHFKAPWTQSFARQDTRPGTFRLADGSHRSVPMMMREKAEFSWLDTEGLTVADIPYGGNAFSMTILLPRQGRSVDDLIATLDAETWDVWMRGLGEPRQGVLALPRFRIEYEAQLKEALTTLGMGVAFSGSADFSRLFTRDDAFLTRVIQKTFVEVNEEGTEAAAATVVGVGLISMPPGVRVDHPFVFAIRERFSGTILFIGKVMDPAAG